MLHRTLPYWLAGLYQFARISWYWYIGIHTKWTKATIFLPDPAFFLAAQRHSREIRGFSVASPGLLV
jgi:hypothetical protein